MAVTGGRTRVRERPVHEPCRFRPAEDKFGASRLTSRSAPREPSQASHGAHGPDGWARLTRPGARTFGPAHATLTLSEISRRAGLSLTTTHRLVGELRAWGALERGEDGRYGIGLRLLEPGALAPLGLQLRELAVPYLDDLHQVTRANVVLVVRDGADVVYVEALRAPARCG
jgi:hypothetical protein